MPNELTKRLKHVVEEADFELLYARGPHTDRDLMLDHMAKYLNTFSKVRVGRLFETQYEDHLTIYVPVEVFK